MRQRINKESLVLILLSVCCLLIWSVVGANPIPDENIAEMNELALHWPNGLSQAEKDKLIGYWGRYPFQFWTTEVKQLVEKRLDEYLPLIMACQETSHAINFELHRWFKSIASDSERQSMCFVLRRWLTDEIMEAPPEGDMRVDGPESAVKLAILMGRVAAAEVLSDYGDYESIAQIERLLDTVPEEYLKGYPRSMTRKGSPGWLLGQALVRLKDPNHGYLFRSIEKGKFELANDYGAIVHASFGRATKSMQIDSLTAKALFSTLHDSYTDGRRVRSSWGLLLDIKFEDGRRAFIDLGHRRPELIYEDNLRVEHVRISLLNEDLYDALENLRTSKEYANMIEEQ